MTKNELEVFLSSDQNEFVRMRKPLSEKICSIRHLTCTPLENRGADPTNIVESSLKAVRDSDIYVGIFGRDYSEITVKEYREAVKNRKPCLTYVRKVKTRDDRLLAFIEDYLQNEFKYSTFRGLKDLTAQIETDLNRFILDTLCIGLDERVKKKQETIALIKKEEKTKPEVSGEKDPLTRAEFAFDKQNYIECLVMTTVAIETTLRNLLSPYTSNVDRKPLSELIQLAAKLLELSPTEVNMLREISRCRNIAVHKGDTPNRASAKWVLETAKPILNRLNSNVGRKNEYAIVDLDNLRLSPDVEAFIRSRKPGKITEVVFRNIVLRIEEISDRIDRTIKKTTISYKTVKPFVGVQLHTTRIVLHLTLPKQPKEKEVAYVRNVYGNLKHGHFVVRNMFQAKFAQELCRKAYNASLI